MNGKMNFTTFKKMIVMMS